MLRAPLFGFLLALIAPALHAQSFQNLGYLPGGSISYAAAVSADGSVVVGSARSELSGANLEAFRWTAEDGMQALGSLPGGVFRSAATAVSADGSVIVGNSPSEDTNPANLHEAFRWTAESGMQSLGSLSEERIYSYATGVSADGSVIVGTAASDEATATTGTEAFRWTAEGGMQGLGFLPGEGVTSTAAAVSADGNIIVGTSTSDEGTEVFRWTVDDGMQSLGVLPGFPRWISPDGTILILSSGSSVFRWTATEGSMNLGAFPHQAAGPMVALSASADGSVVVGNVLITNNEADRAFFWTEDEDVWTDEAGMHPLLNVLQDDQGIDMTGNWPISAAGVSSDGTVIVGYGFTQPGFVVQAFRAVLVPRDPPKSISHEAAAGRIGVSTHPNPARSAVTLAIAVPITGEMRIEVYDVMGRQVATVHDGPLAAGEHSLSLDAAPLAPGVYVIRAVAPTGMTVSRRLTVVR